MLKAFAENFLFPSFCPFFGGLSEIKKEQYFVTSVAHFRYVINLLVVSLDSPSIWQP